MVILYLCKMLSLSDHFFDSKDERYAAIEDGIE